MKKAITIIALALGMSSFAYLTESYNPNDCIATWYNTKPYPRIHRAHSTAAYYRGTRGQFFVVTNLKNNAVDTVEITDCNGSNPKYIDLKEETFHKLSGNKHLGKIRVKIEPLKK